MSLSAQFDWHDGRRALNLLTAMLHDRGLTTKAQGHFMDAVREPRVSVLAGFNLFDAHSGLRAVDWCVPQSKMDEDDVHAIYEWYTDRPLGKVLNPLAVAKKALPPTGSCRKFFGGYRQQWDWWLPAAQIVAILSQKTGAPVKVSDSRVSMETDKGRYEVARRGCWVNFRKRVVDAPQAARDADITLLDVGQRVTRDPLAHVVTSLKLPLAAQWLANSILRSVEVGSMPPVTMSMLEYKPLVGRPRGSRTPRVEALHASLVQAQDVIEGAAEDTTLHGLYRVLVPSAMSKRDFREMIGDPFTKGDREVTPALREKAAEVLAMLERGVPCRQEPAL